MGGHAGDALVIGLFGFMNATIKLINLVNLCLNHYIVFWHCINQQLYSVLFCFVL